MPNNFHLHVTMTVYKRAFDEPVDVVRVASSTAVTAVVWDLPQGTGMAMKWCVCIVLCAGTALGVVYDHDSDRRGQRAAWFDR